MKTRPSLEQLMLKTAFVLVLLLLCAAPVAADPSDAPPLPPNSTLATTPLESTFSPQQLALHKLEGRLVRVGWFDISGIFEQKNNVMTGYAAALLQALSQYTGWRYEWVHVNFKDIPRLLADGTIDLTCGVSYLPSRTGVL